MPLFTLLVLTCFGEGLVCTTFVAGKYANAVECALELADAKENLPAAQAATGDPNYLGYAFCIAESEDHWAAGYEQLRRALSQDPD
jgi:hypothetical protein